MSVSTKIEQLISQTSVLVFSKSFCPYCKKAKGLLSSLNIPFQAFELDQMGEEGIQFQAYVVEKESQRTVPAIWINQKFIGGSDALTKANDSGELKRLLKL